MMPLLMNKLLSDFLFSDYRATTKFEKSILKLGNKVAVSAVEINSIFDEEGYYNYEKYLSLASSIWSEYENDFTPIGVINEKPVDNFFSNTQKIVFRKNILGKMKALATEGKWEPHTFVYFGRLEDPESMANLMTYIEDQESPDGFPDVVFPMILNPCGLNEVVIAELLKKVIKLSALTYDDLVCFRHIFFPNVFGEYLMVS